MAFENNVSTTLHAAVAIGATSIDVVKAVAPNKDVPAVGRLTLKSDTQIEIITYTGRTDNSTHWTLTGVTKNAESSFGDQAWSAGDTCYQALTAADVAGLGGVNMTSAATAPSSPAVGDQWYDTANGVLYVRVTDGTDAAWLDISSANGTAAASSGGGGGAWEVISSTTLTSTATSVDYALTGYTNFMIIMDGVIPANSSNLSVRFKFSKDGGSSYLSTTGDYHNTAISTASNNSSGIFTSGNTNQGTVGNAYMHSTRPYRGQVHISVDDPTTAVFKMAGYVYNSTERYVTTGMIAVQTGTATHIRLTEYAGTGFSAGTFTLYGLKTS